MGSDGWDGMGWNAWDGVGWENGMGLHGWDAMVSGVTLCDYIDIVESIGM